MIKRFLLFIYHLFFKEEEEIPYDKSYSDVVSSPMTKIQQEMNVQQQTRVKKNLDTMVSKDNIQKKNEKVKSGSSIQLNKKIINEKIRTNIYFIDHLMSEMESLNEYLTYYEKLRDLKNQSQNSLKILYRISEEAPYYASTLKAIMRHTKIIGQLLNT